MLNDNSSDFGRAEGESLKGNAISSDSCPEQVIDSTFVQFLNELGSCDKSRGNPKIDSASAQKGSCSVRKDPDGVDLSKVSLDPVLTLNV